jgi:hypothetical protein
MRLPLLTAVLLLAGACSGPTRSTAQAGSLAGAGTIRPGKAAASPKLGDLSFAACTTPPCMYHAGSGDYHDCLIVQQGKCFQYGKSCVPNDHCMVDPQTGSLRACEQPLEGKCLRFSGACQPKGNCVLEPTERRYRICSQLIDGKCARFGAPCQPG